MNGLFLKLFSFIMLLIGLVIWGASAVKLNSQGVFHAEPNVLGLKKSPYGKVLALAVQGPISLYFHQGQSHETSEALAEGGEEHPPGCSCGEHEHHHHHEHHEKPPESNISLHQKAKDQIKRMGAYAHRKTDGEALTPAHLKYLQGETEDKLKLAYELDPSNYTNYGNYHLFLSISSLGKSAADAVAATALARKTLAYCKKDDIDPASWLTAASASYNITDHIAHYYDEFSIEEAKDSLAEFDACMTQYQLLLDESIKKGFNIPTQRLSEMRERARFLGKLREAQGIYMKRVMTQNIKPK